MRSMSKSRLARLSLLCLMLPAMTGCAAALTAPASSYCLVAKHITYDAAQDTAETVAEVEAHNSVFVCVCEADCPKGLR